MNKSLFLAAALLGFATAAWGQCAPNQLAVQVILNTDNYGYETSWQLMNENGVVVHSGDNFASAASYDTTVCVANTGCYSFTIMDSYGDGICCSYGLGNYTVIVNGTTVANGGNFTNSETSYFNCPTGAFCNDTDTLGVGSYAATLNNHWYTFIPDSTGMYEFSTCGTNSCDTKIWIYDRCSGLIWDDTNIGTIYYDDNTCGGLQAVVTAALAAGDTYFIRIGDSNDDCMGQNINWSISYTGPVIGCTDPTACNYNPLATVTDTCIYPGSPDCPTGPDLVLLQNVLVNSMYLDTYNNNDACAVAEQCINGMGTRDLVRFTTHIENNGTQDYFVGNPATYPNQFSNNNCHGHWHYEGYAEYILYDQNATPIPVGFKNGFCVMDLVCDNGGTAQYGCSNMGITAGCGDIYDASLDCQWIDVTTVPDGEYTFVAKVNWDYSPDALGRYETNYENNWAQACITLDRSSGSLQLTINPNCPTFVDCAGVAFGSAVPDCNGVCNGSAVMGDLDGDGMMELEDVENYLQGVTDGSLITTTCNDVFDDDTTNVFDAALMIRCQIDTLLCDFPAGLVNILDTVGLSIVGANFTDKYVDVAMRNPSAKVVGYQFSMSGIEIDTVVNMVSATEYPEVPMFSVANSMITTLSLQDSVIERSSAPQPLCRIYFTQTTDSEICINDIVAVVNNNYQQTIDRIEGPCVQVPNVAVTDLANDMTVKVAPNPFDKQTRFSFHNPNQEAFSLRIHDAMGRLVRSYDNLTGEQFTLHRDELTSGVYLYQLTNGKTIATGKLVIE